MKYYGLHFVGDDKTPVQVCVDSRLQRVFARSCPNGQWTAWRRLDVMRNADGTLAELVSEATHAKSADTAGRLKMAVRLNFTGDATGQASFDGSKDVEVRLSIPQLSKLSDLIDAMGKRPSSDGSSENDY